VGAPSVCIRRGAVPCLLQGTLAHLRGKRTVIIVRLRMRGCVVLGVAAPTVCTTYRRDGQRRQMPGQRRPCPPLATSSTAAIKPHTEFKK